MTVYRTGRAAKAAVFLTAATLSAALPAPPASAANASVFDHTSRFSTNISWTH